MKKYLTSLLLALAAPVAAYCAADTPSGESNDKKTYVTVHTSEGDFTLWLYDDTPIHRDNFIRLCEDGTYEGVIFHRVIKDFLIQGGDPQSRGREPGKGYGDGDGGYCVYSEILPEHFCCAAP